MKNMRFLILGLVMIMASSMALANSQNPNLNWGSTDMMDAMMPPHGGFIFNNKVAMYNADELMDSNGNPMPGTNQLNLVAYIPQAVWISKNELPGHLKWGLQALWPIVTLNANSDLGLTTDNGMLGDPCFGPFIGGVIPFSNDWVLHWMAEFDFYAPVGDYNKNKTFNAGANFWTYEPFIALTLQMPHGFMLDTRQHITFNGENDEYINPSITGDFNTHKLEAGTLWHFNWAFTKSIDSISPALRAGVTGYYGKQLENDEVDGREIADTKEKVFAIGPVIQYTVMDSNGMKPSAIISFKAYKESQVENRAEGNRFFFRVAIPF